MKKTETATEIFAEVTNIQKHFTELTYQVKEESYVIEMPTVEKNSYLQLGDNLTAVLLIMTDKDGNELLHKPTFQSQKEIYNNLYEARYMDLQIYADISEDQMLRQSNLFAIQNTVRKWKKQYE